MNGSNRTPTKNPNGTGNELDRLAESFGIVPMEDVEAERQVIDLMFKDDPSSLKELFAMLEVKDFTDEACRAAYLTCRANYELSQPDLAAEFMERKGADEAVSAVIRLRMRREVEEAVMPVLAASYSDDNLPTAMFIAVEALNKQLRRWRKFLRRFPQASGGIN